MNIVRHLVTAALMTLVTTIILGLADPLIVTGLAQALFPQRANGQLIERNGRFVGSRIIGQPFSSPGYFRSRPSAAGYDGTASGGSNLGPTNARLLARVRADVARLHQENPSMLIPIDLVTSSASGIDPHISPAAAAFQVARVARERGADEDAIRQIVATFTEGRQFGILGEPTVNVLLVNRALDERFPVSLARAR
jgi:K+-transporting ATPase ATPase C chain